MCFDVAGKRTENEKMCGIILECDFIGEIFHGEPEKLKECYYNSLKLAYDNNLHSIAFPSISTGAYGYSV